MTTPELDADGRPFEPHLIPRVTDRGFLHMPNIPGTYVHRREYVRVYESSAAVEACIWIMVSSTAMTENGMSVHLTLEEATHLRDQLTYLIENHYQVKPR